MSFGTRLRGLREAAGLTQEELADRAGLSAKAVSLLERGERRRPYPHTVRSLAEALGLSEAERAALAASVTGRRPHEGRTPGLPGPPLSPAPPGSAVQALPLPPTPLVGRERERDEVVELLSHVRLLTLTGPGGVGKTRLAMEAVRAAADRFADGATFVDLAPLGGADLVLPTVARSLGLTETGTGGPRELLHRFLLDRHLLLALDNLEHVLGAAPEVAALLAGCPRLAVLGTSRAPLRVRGEREYAVEPLGLPLSGRALTARDVMASSAGRLFLQRATETTPAFEITDDNAAAVGAICQRVAGIPLALELAAARTRVLGPAELLARLDQALEAGGARDLPRRQQTMRSTLDWSHDLLSEAERAAFARLAVFAGGFDLEAAEVVAGESPDLSVRLGDLIEQSLVETHAGAGGELRYRLLEPVRQYALDRLRARGEEDRVRRLHAEHYLALAEAAEPQIKGRDQIEWLDRLAVENDNLRAALGWSAQAGEGLLVARFGWALRMYWLLRARQGEGRLLLAPVPELIRPTPTAAPLPVLWQARALNALAVCLYGWQDGDTLMACAEESLALFAAAGDPAGHAYGLGMVAFAALQQGDLDRADALFATALEKVRELGDAWNAAHLLSHLAVAPLRRGDLRRAAELAGEALDLTSRTGDRLAVQTSYQILARVAWAGERPEEADRHFLASLRVAAELSDRVNVAYCLQGLAATAWIGDEPLRAARLLGAAQDVLESAGVPAYAWTDRELHQRTSAAVRSQLGDEAWAARHAEGRALTLERAVAYALRAPTT